MPEQIIVGIDVSQNKLDVHIRPTGAVFSTDRNGAGLADLCARLKALDPRLVAIEATGGYETTAAAAMAGAGLPVVRQSGAGARLCKSARQARQDRSDRRGGHRAFRRSHEPGGAGAP